ncbi:MAG: hypothetical protein JXA30_16785 [Deltaproteobacteria bacterium]|nr:hypothetical protein [Deltaproteobacteria bacterium]
MGFGFILAVIGAYSACEALLSGRRYRVPIKALVVCTAIYAILAVCGCVEEGRNRAEPVLLREVVDVAVGEAHSCAARRDGTVVCWGYNAGGQLGSDPEIDDFETLDPVGITTERVRGFSRHASAVEGLSAVRRIAAGANHTCVIVNDGSVWCWGDSASGQLGNGEFSLDSCEGRPCSRKPVRVKGINNAASLSLGERHSCALLDNGDLRCWGSLALGHASDDLVSCDGLPCATSPVHVDLADDVLEVKAGYQHTCALVESGAVFCWGQNPVGQVGISRETDVSVQGVDRPNAVDRPARVNLPEPAGQVAVAGSSVAYRNKSCARLLDGSYFCWGVNDRGELGIAPVQTERCGAAQSFCATEPRELALEVAVERVILSEFTGCAVSIDGVLYCWGQDTLAQLGRDAQIQDRCVKEERCSRLPVKIPTRAKILDVALGHRYSCALQADERVVCWGWGYPMADTGSARPIDCSSSLDPCVVERTWAGRPKSLVMTHFDTFCVVTEQGELHCLGDFVPDLHAIESEPMQVYP